MLNLKSVRAVYFPSLNARQINRGDCYRWAYVVKRMFSKAILCSDLYEGTHAFIRIEGLYYDSQSPLGVRHWRNLAFYRSDSAASIKRLNVTETGVTEFQRLWGNIRSFARNKKKLGRLKRKISRDSSRCR